jgi:hypothetical protein
MVIGGNMPTLTDQQIQSDISSLKTFWGKRNTKMKGWYSLLLLTDTLAAKGMESYVSNEPQTFYNMSHYLLTKGAISHNTPITSENGAELDRMARIDRGCKYLWDLIDRTRQGGGDKPYIDELAFFMLVTGWYSTVFQYDDVTGKLIAQIWNPADSFPRYSGGILQSCVHSYLISEQEAVIKATMNGWNYTPPNANNLSNTVNLTLDDYFITEIAANKEPLLYNMVLIGGKPVTALEDRPDMKLLVAPVGGFPDKGSLQSSSGAWTELAGRSVFEANSSVVEAFNKWKTMLSQILRDSAQPVTEEFSATPQAKPEELRERGALFHYAPGEQGLVRLPPPAIPIELQGNLIEIRRELQKGSYNDAVFGMMEGQQAGYALSLLASSSANQILYPFMDAKHFILSEADRFWLSNLKKSNKTFTVNGKLVEIITPNDIPDDVTVTVSSDVATPKDWMERGTIAGMLKDHLDEATIVTEILKMNDPQGIKRRRSVDRMLLHPMTQQIELISGYQVHAEYLQSRGDAKQAALFLRAAQQLEAQMGTPENGQGNPSQITPQNTGLPSPGAPEKKTPVNSQQMPPEERGFTPAQLRQSIGRGKIRQAPQVVK